MANQVRQPRVARATDVGTFFDRFATCGTGRPAGHVPKSPLAPGVALEVTPTGKPQRLAMGLVKNVVAVRGDKPLTRKQLVAGVI